MKTISCLLNDSKFIVFNDYLYDIVRGNKVYRDRDFYEQLKKNSVIYYKARDNVTKEQIDEYVYELKNGHYLIFIDVMTLEDTYLNMEIEAHELYLQLNGYTKYENS